MKFIRANKMSACVQLSHFFVSLLVFVLLAATPSMEAEISVRLSVKFILNPDGTRPMGGIGNSDAFQNEIDRGNRILASTFRGFFLQVVEYIDIQPAASAGQPNDYWFNLPARANRVTIENAALADPMTWRWNSNTINMYVNNSSSAQCSFVGGGLSISFGKTISQGTVLHELGHFFNLNHTHLNDYADNPPGPDFTAADLFDGDSLAETAPDNPNITANDQLCNALFSTNYTAATPAQRATVDSAFENVMSYHNANVLLSVQMDIWALNANESRLPFCSGRTWFVANGGSDSANGNNANSPFATLTRSLSAVATANDIVLLRAGSYVGGTLQVPCTLSATRGPALIVP